MEIFADAVFAIAFTLPVLELKIAEDAPSFAAGVVALWPSYLAYGLTALVIGIYWVHHHFSGAIYRTTGHHFLLATILFLTAVGFIGFPTRALAEHADDPAALPDAVLYVCALAALNLAWLIKWKTGCATNDIDDRLDPAYVQRLTRKYTTTSALIVGAAIVAVFSWQIGLAAAAVITLYYVRAPETPVYTTAAPTVEGEA